MSRSESTNPKPVRVEIGKILEILPHRFPMLLVDRVVDLVPGQSIQARKMVSANEPWVQGHFSGEPMMPGVLILEALSQAGALLAYASDPFDAAKSRLYFLGFDKVKFRNTVTPGDQLDLSVELIDHKVNVWKLRAEATVGGTLCAQAELLASVVDHDK